jgi:hypothetical protein
MDDEITQEMIDAGLLAYSSFSTEFDPPSEIVKAVYLAMRAKAFVVCPVCEDERSH